MGTCSCEGICALPLTFWRKSHSNSYIGCLMIAFFFQINAMNAATEAACLILSVEKLFEPITHQIRDFFLQAVSLHIGATM